LIFLPQNIYRIPILTYFIAYFNSVLLLDAGLKRRLLKLRSKNILFENMGFEDIPVRPPNSNGFMNFVDGIVRLVDGPVEWFRGIYTHKIPSNCFCLHSLI